MRSKPAHDVNPEIACEGNEFEAMAARDRSSGFARLTHFLDNFRAFARTLMQSCIFLADFR